MQRSIDEREKDERHEGTTSTKRQERSASWHRTEYGCLVQSEMPKCTSSSFLSPSSCCRTASDNWNYIIAVALYSRSLGSLLPISIIARSPLESSRVSPVRLASFPSSPISDWFNSQRLNRSHATSTQERFIFRSFEQAQGQMYA